MHIFFNFSLPFPWQPRFSIFSTFQLFFKLEMVHFGTAIPKRPHQKCMWLCNIIISLVKYYPLIHVSLLICFHGNKFWHRILYSIMHFAIP